VLLASGAGKTPKLPGVHHHKKRLGKMVSFYAGAPTTLNEHNADLTFIPTLQYWGVPENPTRLDLRIWETQERFLRLFARSGKVIQSVDLTGITRQCLYKWENADKFGFNKRLEIAHQEYVERLEQELDDYISESKHNVQIAHIFRLKAEAPEKYREDIKPQSNDASRELLDRLTEMARKELEERRRLEEGVAEGEYRELKEPGQG
jgi:hypothetical protein